MNIPLKDNNSSTVDTVLVLNKCFITYREEGKLTKKKKNQGKWF